MEAWPLLQSLVQRAWHWWGVAGLWQEAEQAWSHCRAAPHSALQPPSGKSQSVPVWTVVVVQWRGQFTSSLVYTAPRLCSNSTAWCQAGLWEASSLGSPSTSRPALARDRQTTARWSAARNPGRACGPQRTGHMVQDPRTDKGEEWMQGFHK